MLLSVVKKSSTEVARLLTHFVFQSDDDFVDLKLVSSVLHLLDYHFLSESNQMKNIIIIISTSTICK